MKSALPWGSIAGLLLLITGCGGGTGRVPQGTDQPTVTISTPPAMTGGSEAAWQVNIVGGTPPYSVSWDLGKGALESFGTEETSTGVLPIAAVMLNPLNEPATYSYTVTVTDSAGNTIPASGDYTVAPGAVPTRPVIESAEYYADLRELQISVNHWNAPAELSVNLSLPPGMNAPLTEDNKVGIGQSLFRFKLYPDDVVDGATGSVTVDVTDSLGFTDQLVTEVAMPGYELEPDTLYAIPLQTSAYKNEPVQIVIATGPISEGKPFQYLNSVVVYPDNGELNVDSLFISFGSMANLMPGTFNAGEPGGSTGDVDGFWEYMWPEGGYLYGDPGFLLPPDSVSGFGIPWELTFSLTPIGGKDVTGAYGELFNFEASFNFTGNLRLEFQEIMGVERTYYTDVEGNKYRWGDISNDHPGIPNTISVIE